MPGSIPRRFLALLCAAAGVLPISAPHAEEFFPIRSENPLLRGFYVPLPSDARRDSGAVFAADFSLSNSLNVESRGQESLFVDGESATLRLQYERSFSSVWHYRLTLPVMRDSGGFLDTVIDDYHRGLGFQRGFRPYYPKNRIDYAYGGASRIGVHQDQTGLGDLDLEAGWFGVDTPGTTLSVWGGVEAPTGRARQLTGNGAWDTAAWLHWAVRGLHWQGALEAGVTQPLGYEVFAGAAHRTTGFGRAAVTRSVGAVWSARVQLEAQSSRVRDSRLRLLGPTLEAAFGLTRALGGHWRMQCGFIEDAAVNTAPDITFFLGIHN